MDLPYNGFQVAGSLVGASIVPADTGMTEPRGMRLGRNVLIRTTGATTIDATPEALVVIVPTYMTVADSGGESVRT